jgi:hypothetical protein
LYPKELDDSDGTAGTHVYEKTFAAQLFAFATAQIQKQTVCLPFGQGNLHETSRFDPGIQVPLGLFSSL